MLQVKFIIPYRTWLRIQMTKYHVCCLRSYRIWSPQFQSHPLPMIRTWWDHSQSAPSAVPEDFEAESANTRSLQCGDARSNCHVPAPCVWPIEDLSHLLQKLDKNTANCNNRMSHWWEQNVNKWAWHRKQFMIGFAASLQMHPISHNHIHPHHHLHGYFRLYPTLPMLTFKVLFKGLFTRWMAIRIPNRQHQNTEGNTIWPFLITEYKAVAFDLKTYFKLACSDTSSKQTGLRLSRNGSYTHILSISQYCAKSLTVITDSHIFSY